MAIAYSDQAAKIYKSGQTGGYNVDKLSTTEYNGRVRLFYAHYVATEAITEETTIKLNEVPAGRILPTSKVYFGAGGADATLDIGHEAYINDAGDEVAEDTTALLSAADVKNAGSAELNAEPAGYILTGKTMLTATTSTLAANTAIDVYVFCVVD